MTSQDTTELDAVAELFKVLSAPLRLAVLHRLHQAGDQCVHDLVDATGATQPLISQHLRVLRTAHLVRADRNGREVVYSLTDDHVAHIVADALTHIREDHS